MVLPGPKVAKETHKGQAEGGTELLYLHTQTDSDEHGWSDEEDSCCHIATTSANKTPSTSQSFQKIKIHTNHNNHSIGTLYLAKRWLRFSSALCGDRQGMCVPGVIAGWPAGSENEIKWCKKKKKKLRASPPSAIWAVLERASLNRVEINLGSFTVLPNLAWIHAAGCLARLPQDDEFFRRRCTGSPILFLLALLVCAVVLLPVPVNRERYVEVS